MELDLGVYDTYGEAVSSFEWDVPDTFNIAEAVCGRWAKAIDGKRRVALFFEREDGEHETYTFWQIARGANRVSNALQDLGIEPGSRVGIVLPQRPETLLANLGILQLGAVAVPLSPLYGTEGLRYRLDHSAAKAVIVDGARAETVGELQEDLGALETILTLDDPDIEGKAWKAAVDHASSRFDMVETAAEDSSYVIYTSGTTGTPKGAHHAHRKLIGYLPGWQMINECPGAEAVHYTPAGWSWVGGLFAVVWCAWYHGQPVVGYDGRFDPQTTFDLMERYGVTNALLTPTMIRMMAEEATPPDHFDLQVVPSGGEPVTPDLYDYVETAWDAVVNEIYGQTECNFVIGTSHRLIELKPEATGKPCPGHEVAIIDESTGEELDEGEIGHIAVRRPDPGMLVDYWDDPDTTESLFVDDWMLTGDAGSYDADGFVYFEGRADDVIVTSGYRVSPLEVESCLRAHKAVADAVVVGIDDETRGTIVKAFVKLTAGVEASEELTEQLQSFVRDREAAYKYPRSIKYVDEFPTTVSGKIQRHKLTEEV